MNSRFDFSFERSDGQTDMEHASELGIPRGGHSLEAVEEAEAEAAQSRFYDPIRSTFPIPLRSAGCLPLSLSSYGAFVFSGLAVVLHLAFLHIIAALSPICLPFKMYPRLERKYFTYDRA